MRTLTTTIAQLNFCYQDLMFNSLKAIAEGFTVGSGKTLYWYVLDTKYGNYTVVRINQNNRKKTRVIKPDQLVTIHYLDQCYPVRISNQHPAYPEIPNFPK